jgi:uncharacterized RDD family membrane protein YckC
MEHNAYAPPRVEVGIPPIPPQVSDLASRGHRLANLLIDTVGYFLLAVFVGALMTAFAPDLTLSMTTGLPGYLFGAAIMILYYLASEALFGRTLGKLLTGTRTVSESGGPASLSQILRRTLARFIPFEFVTFLGTPVGLHDKWSGTRVIRNSAYFG